MTSPAPSGNGQALGNGWGPHSLILNPLMARGELKGMLCLYRFGDHHPFTEEQPIAVSAAGQCIDVEADIATADGRKRCAKRKGPGRIVAVPGGGPVRGIG